MSNSALVSYTKLSPNKTDKRTHEIDTITIHCMAGNLTVEACGEVFERKTRMASSNYGISSTGKIALYVDESARSWCSSNKANDMRAVTIEVANDGGADTGWHVSDKAMKSLINLCADICKRNNIKKLVWSEAKTDRVKHLNGCNMTVHRDFAAKSCPGDYLYRKHGYIATEVNKLICDEIEKPEIAKATIKQGNKGENVLNLQEDLNYCIEIGNLNAEKIDCDGSAGPKTIALLKEWQYENGLNADGSYGPRSYERMKAVIG